MSYLLTEAISHNLSQLLFFGSVLLYVGPATLILPPHLCHIFICLFCLYL